MDMSKEMGLELINCQYLSMLKRGIDNGWSHNRIIKEYDRVSKILWVRKRLEEQERFLEKHPPNFEHTY